MTGIWATSSNGLFITYLIESFPQHFSFNNVKFGPGSIFSLFNLCFTDDELRSKDHKSGLPWVIQPVYDCAGIDL